MSVSDTSVPVAATWSHPWTPAGRNWVTFANEHARTRITESERCFVKCVSCQAGVRNVIFMCDIDVDLRHQVNNPTEAQRRRRRNQGPLRTRMRCLRNKGGHHILEEVPSCRRERLIFVLSVQALEGLSGQQDADIFLCRKRETRANNPQNNIYCAHFFILRKTQRINLSIRVHVVTRKNVGFFPTLPWTGSCVCIHCRTKHRADTRRMRQVSVVVLQTSGTANTAQSMSK